MGYHIAKINKGEYGKFSKIQEEYEEARDALTQNCPVMVLLELSDLIGAIEGYAKTYNVTLEDLIKMKNLTKSAFEDGSRKIATVVDEVGSTTKIIKSWNPEDIKNVQLYEFNSV